LKHWEEVPEDRAYVEQLMSKYFAKIEAFWRQFTSPKASESGAATLNPFAGPGGNLLEN